jgi:hypothetical protein
MPRRPRAQLARDIRTELDRLLVRDPIRRHTRRHRLVENSGDYQITGRSGRRLSEELQGRRADRVGLPTSEHS